MKLTLKICFVLVFFSSFKISFSQTTNLGDAKKIDQGEKYIEVLNLIRNYYTDTVNEEKLVEDAIKKDMEDLDPHSAYVPAKDVKRSEEGLVGNFEGVGITFQILKDTIIVLEVIPSGPSEKVGLLAGDKIIEVNDSIVAGVKIDNEKVIKKLRGPKGTKVKVGIMRRDDRKLIDFTIIRDKIPIYSVTASYIVQPGIGYVRLERFSANTMQEFTQAINKLRDVGMKNLILDLQGNVGGYLYTAIDMGNQFLEGNKLIVYTQGVHSNYQPYFSNNTGMFKDGKVVVMVDEGSASAAEILSGCIQDNDRGLLVGRRTFGKGFVQKPFPFMDGSELRLTTAHYYTPSGRCIQKSYSNGIKDYREDYKDRFESGELFGKDTFKFSDSLLYHTTNGRKVYGGGGVMPDYFVPYDTSMSSPTFNLLVRSGAENKFCLEYVDRNRDKLNHLYPTADSFFYKFNIDTTILGEYLASAVNDSVLLLNSKMKPKSFGQYFGAIKNDTIINFEKDFTKSELVIKARLKAMIGRNLFDSGLFYRVINATINNVFAKAVEVINTNSDFNVLKPKVADEKDLKKRDKKEKPKKKVILRSKTKGE